MDASTNAPVHQLLAATTGGNHDDSRAPVSRLRAHVPRPIDDHQLFNAVFDSSAEALVLVDSAGGIQRANSRARELLRLQDARKNGS
jgi:PAS domain-containing protein